MTAGKLITFEGGEGSGKSTQARLLAERLGACGIRTVVTREPGGTPLGESIRELILSGRPARDAEFLLFAAARAEHVALKIAPALTAGQWVICDRYIDSTRVYQGRLAGVEPQLLQAIEAHTVRQARPALTIVLDVAPPTGRERAAARGALNRYDAELPAYHEAIRRGFLDIARSEPERCVVIDGSRTEAEVATQVWSAVSARLGVAAV